VSASSVTIGLLAVSVAMRHPFLLQSMLHGLGYGISDMGTDPNVRLVKAVTLGQADTVQNLDIDVRTHNFTYGSCNFKLFFLEYFNSYKVINLANG